MSNLGLFLRSLLVLALAVPGPCAPPARVCVAQVHGTIGPATASYLARALGEAAGQQAQCLVIQLDTPGGLLDSTKEIIQSFLRSPVPTVVYVSPQGAWAGSAGCFITMAADVAAMAPATSIGAAHPVEMGGGGGSEDEVMKQKLENFTASYMESIAAKRHRNTEWARPRCAKAPPSPPTRRWSCTWWSTSPRTCRTCWARWTAGRWRPDPAHRRSGRVQVPMTAREKVF